MNTLGERIKDLRKSACLNQDDVVIALNSTFNTSIVRPMLSKWENNKEYPRADFIKYLSIFFNVSMDYLTCNSNYKNTFDEVIHNPHLINQLQDVGMLPTGDLFKVPILGDIKAGYNYCANEMLLGYEYVDKNTINSKQGCFFLRITGDSMQPLFIENDLVLIEPASNVDSGTIAAILIDNEEATLKRVIKQDSALILQPLNSMYAPRIFSSNELSSIKILGKVIQSIRKFN